MSWRRLLFSVSLSVGLLLFLRQAWATYEEVQRHDFRFFQPLYLLAALAMSLLIYGLQMLAWTMIMRYLGFSPSLRQTLEGYFLSFLPRYVPGSVWGYWSRSEWLERCCGVGYATSIFGSILEAWTLILTALSMAGTYLCTRSAGARRFALGAACAGLLSLACLVTPVLVTRLSKERLHFDSKGHALHAWLAAVALHMALWVAYGTSILLIGKAVAPTPSVGLLQATFSTGLSWLAGFVVIIVPTGIGVRELALSTLLPVHSNLLPWQANLVAIMSRFEIILAELAWLMIGLGIYICRRWRDSSQAPPFVHRGEE